MGEERKEGGIRKGERKKGGRIGGRWREGGRKEEGKEGVKSKRQGEKGRLWQSIEEGAYVTKRTRERDERTR